MAYHRFHKVDTRIVRIFNTYGTHGPRRWSCPSELVETALLGQPLTVYGEGNQTRSFCFVDDLVDGIVRLLYSDEHLPVNIGNQDEMSILEFAETINRITGNKAGITFVKDARSVRDPQQRRISPGRARSGLGTQRFAGRRNSQDCPVL